MVADKGKKQTVAEEGEENNNNNNTATDHIDRDLVLSVEKLQEVQDQIEKINEEANDKVLEVEQEYNEIRKPIYDKRNDIVKSIPDFWFTCFVNHPVLSDLLTEEDQKIFKYLSFIEVEDFKDVKLGYSISFNFNPNPFFEDAKLTKTFTFLEEGTTKITATPIKWKDGMSLANGVANEKKGNKRSHTEESFFTWFSDSEQKDEDADEIHDEVAEIIKEDLWPNPLAYFSLADEEDFDGEEGDDEEKGTDGFEDDDDQDDDDDNEDGNEDEGN